RHPGNHRAGRKQVYPWFLLGGPRCIVHGSLTLIFSIMSLLIGSTTIGLVLAFLALGIFISFRVFKFPDITAEGSFTLGASTAAALIVAGVNPLVASIIAFFAGMIAGSATG